MKRQLSPWLTALVRHERLVAAALTGVAVLAGLHALQPASGRLVPVLAAARSLAGGSPLTVADLAVVRIPPAAVPDGALSVPSDAAGQIVAGPVGRGELLTSTRLVGRALLDAVAPGSLAVPVRIADPGSAALVHAGDRVDLLAVPTDGGPAVVVGLDLPVLTVPPQSEASLGDGALIVVAATRTVAAVVAAASATQHVSVVLRGH